MRTSMARPPGRARTTDLVAARATGHRSHSWDTSVAIGLFVIGVYLLSAFGVGVGLHRYFAHRSFQTSRGFQFVLCLLAGIAFGDPVWFAGKHRLHHKHSDTTLDVHSPAQGFLVLLVL